MANNKCECDTLEWLKKEKGGKEGEQIHQLICEIQRKTLAKEKLFGNLEKEWGAKLSKMEDEYKTLQSQLDEKSHYIHSTLQASRPKSAMSPSYQRLVYFFLFILILISSRGRNALQAFLRELLRP
ncbi:hypothetical protein RFI_33859 [Reticulomyxa filosa]|uniref:Uncharacterized protein n=1 Tax=Reticulomyxa filosa TaxID=46433 RepID=X6LNN7_RETFI|nr:hypothetical protein RFI_33859 [Reticulomyxa filosa]|eukprot:ETO03543.1 hypothetical protein RFI_33859 [Reticulomyxa filosa]